uniref:Uncharacterized protein n=1 Tax=Globodera rostochiensis TaxID=31243 RepID=A0A914I169_GLORO
MTTHFRASTSNATQRSIQYAFFGYDPEPGVPMDVTPMAQCAFESSVFKVSAVHTNYRSWLRSSSIHEPSTGPNTSSHHGHGRSTQAQTCRKAQQPLNDAQTPAQPLGCPVGVLPPLAQRPDDSSNRRLTHRATNIGYTPTLMCPQGAVRTLLVNVPANTQRACVRQQQTEACGVAHTDSTGQQPLRLNRFQSTRRPKPTRIIVPEFLEMAQSRAATGGVYKGQGRIQSELMTRPYKEFLVHGQ